MDANNLIDENNLIEMDILHRNYDHYLNNYKKVKQPKNLDRTNLLSIIDNCQGEINNFPNIIIYGRKNIGKYSEALNFINSFKPIVGSEKHINVNYNKNDYNIKFSNIHYEIDFSLLGCNAKAIWHEIYITIQDIIKHSSITDVQGNNGNRPGIILCKNFHTINQELLEIFYSYIQTDIFAENTIRFIILTEHYSFLPTCIQNQGYMYRCPIKSAEFYKQLNQNTNRLELNDTHKIICDKILYQIYDFNNNVLDSDFFITLRANLYDLLVLNINIHDAIYYIIIQIYTNKNKSTKKTNISTIDMNKLLYITYNFLRKYNNNYRPIYHLESFILNIIKSLYEK